MPTYDYECSNCGYKFEVFQNITDKPKEKCPKCNKKVKRLIGIGSGVIFKGSGFYATDYKKKPQKDTPLGSSQATCPKAKEGCTGCQNNG